MNLRRLATGLALPLLLLAACRGSDVPGADASNAQAPAPMADGTIPLRVRTAAGRDIAFAMEVALDDAAQQKGLQGRSALPATGGMLFPFARPRDASFWMKETLIPLDLLFVRPDGTIAAVLEGKPGDLHPLFAGEPVLAVVEIAGGRAAALGIAPGDLVRWGQCPGSATRPGEAWDPLNFCPPAP